MTLFSIVIPFYNSKKTIKKCLDGIFKSTFKSFEVIAVSDNSDQESIDIVKKFKTKLIYLKKNRGTAFARNIGAKNSKGKFIIFIDSDIVIKSNHLLEVKKNLEKFPLEVAFQGIYNHKINYKNSIVSYLQLYQCYYIFSKKITFIKNLNGSFVVIKKNFFLKLKGFDNNFKSSNAEDADFGYNITNSGKSIRLLRNVQVTHIPQWTFTFFKIIPFFYIHIFLFIICFFKGLLEYYINNEKY